MDETYGTYVDDEYFDNHDYDDTDDDLDHKNDKEVMLLINPYSPEGPRAKIG